MLKLVVISHHLAFAQYQIRWKQLAEEYPVEVAVLIPETWCSGYYQGAEQRIITLPYRSGRYEVVPVRVTNNQDWWLYQIVGLEEILKWYQPDVVFAIADEFFEVTRQCARLRFGDAFKLVFFSTHACLQLRNAADFPHRMYYRMRWEWIKRRTDAILCHYPRQVKQLRALGYKGYASVQTQVGIDMDVFFPDSEARARNRRERGWEGARVVGFAGRMIEAKGIFTLFDAAKDEDWTIVYLGSGPDTDRLKARVDAVPHRCHVDFIPKVPALEVGQYLNAFDLFYTGSLTQPDWDDTFPNAVVQAEACKVPVVVSDSCALPFIAGDTPLIFPEGKAALLRDVIRAVISDPDRLRELGLYGYERCRAMFGTQALNRMFHQSLLDITGAKEQPQ